MSPTSDRPDVAGTPSVGGWYPPPSWQQAPGWYPAPPPPPSPSRRRGAVVAWTVAGIALAICLLVLIWVAGNSVGRSMDDMVPPPPAAETAPPADPGALGDDPGLDTYAQRCEDGDMQACDDLYDLSEVMSDYEQYGMTCGGRVKPFDVTYCTELD